MFGAWGLSRNIVQNAIGRASYVVDIYNDKSPTLKKINEKIDASFCLSGCGRLSYSELQPCGVPEVTLRVCNEDYQGSP